MEIFDDRELKLNRYLKNIHMARIVMWCFTGLMAILPLLMGVVTGVGITAMHVSPFFILLILCLIAICAGSYKKPYTFFILFDSCVFLLVLLNISSALSLFSYEGEDAKFSFFNIIFLVLLILLSFFMANATKIARRYERLKKEQP